MICTNVSCRNLDPHNHGDDCDDFCQTCNTPLSQRPPEEPIDTQEIQNDLGLSAGDLHD